MGALIDPDALNARLGQAAASNPRFFADPFAETKLLRRAALEQTGQRFFIPDSKTDEAQRRALYDNAAAFAASRSDVHLGVAFTDAQIAALSQPILWYVDDGTGVLAPVVYLPKVSQQNLVHQEGGRIIADEASLQVAGAFTNTGFVTVSGALAIDAGSIVNEQRTARDPATAWTAQVALRDDVTWRAVQEAHQSWDYKTQGLSGAAAAVIAIAVAVAPQGAGAAALGGFGGTIGAAMGDAAFSALVSQAAVSVINNRGDIGKVLKELGTAQTAKNLAIAMVSAGLTQGIADAAGVSGGAKPTADFADRLAYQGIKTASGVAANTVIGGADLGDALKSGGLSLATTMATQVLAKGVGDMAVDLKIDDGDLRKIIAHALAGCAAGQITKNCVAGAIGAGIQEAAGGAIGKLSDDIEQRVMLAGLSAAVATMVVGGDASAVNTANGIAQDAATYNRQLHVKEVQKLRELAPEYANRQGISESEALQRLLAQALRNVDQAYYETHSQWDKSADEFLGRNASGTITVEGKEVLMFAAGGKDYYANPTLLADTWNAFNREAAIAYQQTPIKLKSERFETQQKVLEAYLTVVGMLPLGGGIIATLARYDDAVRNGDTQTQRDIEMMLPLDLVPYAMELGKLAKGIKSSTKIEKQLSKTEPEQKEYVDILSPESRQHILYGDKPGSGGHLWPGQPGKTVFPESWSADKVIHEVGDIATSPNTQWYAQTGSGGVFTAGGKPANWVAYEVRDGVRMRVVYQPATGKVVTAFPDSDPIPNYKAIPR